MLDENERSTLLLFKYHFPLKTQPYPHQCIAYQWLRLSFTRISEQLPDNLGTVYYFSLFQARSVSSAS